MFTAILLGFCGATVAGAGVALMLVSLHSASQRGERVWRTFWAPREMFVGLELALNRIGFLMSIAGLGLLLFAMYLLAN